MNNAAMQYLEGIGAGPALIAKVEAAVHAFVFLCGSDPERIFVCDTVDTVTGDQSYSSVWGFHGGMWMEAREEGSNWDVDISSYVDGIYYLSIQYTEIMLPEQVSERSRLTVEIQTDKLSYSSMSAAGWNCRSLLDIVDELFRPNVRVNPKAS